MRSLVAGKTLSETYPDDGGLFEQGAAAGEEIARRYENCDYNGAMREIMVLADRANQYIEAKEPWKLRKDESRQDELRDICSVGLNLFRQIVVYLAPVLPRLAEQAGELLGQPVSSWADAGQPLTGTPVGKFKHMMQRVDPRKVEAMIEESKDNTAADDAAASDAASEFNDGPEALEKEPLTEEHCTIDDFMKVDMRVARRDRGQSRRRSRQAPAADAFAGRRGAPERVCRHQKCLRPRRTGRSAGRLLCQPEAAEDAVRCQRGNGARLRSGGQGHLPAQPRHRRNARHAGALIHPVWSGSLEESRMSGRVLSIGQCGFDHGNISRFLGQEFGVTVVAADDENDARDELQRSEFRLVLINRKLDLDGSDGVALLKRLQRDDLLGATPAMLVSNYADAQQAAVAAGARPGFGKAEIGDPQVTARLAEVLSETPAEDS